MGFVEGLKRGGGGSWLQGWFGDQASWDLRPGFSALTLVPGRKGFCSKVRPLEIVRIPTSTRALQQTMLTSDPGFRVEGLYRTYMRA